MYLSIRIEFSKTEEPGPQLQLCCLFLLSLTVVFKYLLVFHQEINVVVSVAKEGGDLCNSRSRMEVGENLQTLALSYHHVDSRA